MDCNIRRWLLSDASDLAKSLNNKEIQDNLRDGLPYPYGVTDAEYYIKEMIVSPADVVFAFAITVNDVAIGSISVFRQDNIHRQTAELGYYIAQPYWGKGIATSAIEQICQYIFVNTDIIRIFAEPFSDNIGSRRVLEKIGFQLEGILRSNAVKNGVVKDMAIYSLLK